VTEPGGGAAPEVVVAGLLREYEQVANLSEGLSAVGWNASTVCDGWQVRHIVAHVAGQLQDAVSGRGGSRTADEQACALGSATASDLAAAIRGASAKAESLAELIVSAWREPSPVRETIGEAIETLWHDTWTHGNDIRAALGADADEGAGMQTSLRVVETRLHERAWPGAIQRTHDQAIVEIHVPNRAPVMVPTRTFLLAATGRRAWLRPEVAGNLNIYA
jgi:uncharacterized protein (TIGR03083 family)